MKFPRLRVESNDFLHLDMLRFFAALGVIVLHYRLRLDLPLSWEPARQGLEPLSLFVDLFFVISGVVITYVYAERIGTAKDYADFLKKRFARLVPLHWLTLAFYVFLSTAAAVVGLKLINPGRYESNCLLSHIFLLHAVIGCQRPSYNFVSWSISAEMMLYLSFPVLLMLFRVHRFFPLLMAFVAVVILYWFFSGADGDRAWYNWSYEGGFIRAIPAFLFGMTLYLNRSYLRYVPYPQALLFGGLLLFFVMCFSGIGKAEILPLVYFIGFAGVAADVQRHTLPIVRRLAPLGQLTYSSYMLHAPVQTIFIAGVIEKLMHLHGLEKNMAILATIILVFIISYFSFFWVETPLRKKIGKWKPFTRAKQEGEPGPEFGAGR